MKIYTKTGDKGQTGLVDNSRASKADPRLEVLGVFDEANAHLGVVAAHITETHPQYALVIRAQSLMFNCGAYLADPRSPSPLEAQLPTEAFIRELEHSIDALSRDLSVLTGFIIPGGSLAAAHVHVARTVVRRAERTLVKLMQTDGAIAPIVLQYMNRLSDWLFVVARSLNQEAGAGDLPWSKEIKKG